MAVALAAVLTLGACDGGPIGPFAEIEVIMAFVTSRDGNDELYGVDAMGNKINLTNHTAHDRSPVWSPDGERIAFTRQFATAREVMVLDAQTGEARNVSNSPTSDDRDPSWSPDGRALVFTSDRDGNDEVYRVDADGSGLENLTRHPAPDGDPAWSPEGSEIAFTTGRELRAAVYAMDTSGSGIRRMSGGGPWDDTKPAWHPTGEVVAYESTRDGASEIVTSDGVTEVVLTNDPGHDIQPRWSPDGTQILFLSNRDDQLWDVWMASGADGSGAAAVSGATIDRDAGASWSPDGGEVAFETRRFGDWDILTMATDGTNLRPVTTDPANDGSAQWRPGR